MSQLLCKSIIDMGAAFTFLSNIVDFLFVLQNQCGELWAFDSLVLATLVSQMTIYSYHPQTHRSPFISFYLLPKASYHYKPALFTLTLDSLLPFSLYASLHFLFLPVPLLYIALLSAFCLLLTCFKLFFLTQPYYPGTFVSYPLYLQSAIFLSYQYLPTHNASYNLYVFTFFSPNYHCLQSLNFPVRPVISVIFLFMQL